MPKASNYSKPETNGQSRQTVSKTNLASFDYKEHSPDKPLSQGSDKRGHLRSPPDDQLMIQGTFKTFHIQSKKCNRDSRVKAADSTESERANLPVSQDRVQRPTLLEPLVGTPETNKQNRMIRISSGQRELKCSKPSDKITVDTRNLPTSTVPQENPNSVMTKLENFISEPFVDQYTLELEPFENEKSNKNETKIQINNDKAQNKEVSKVASEAGLNTGRKASVEAWTSSN